jgi:hypothetical protein
MFTSPVGFGSVFFFTSLVALFFNRNYDGKNSAIEDASSDWSIRVAWDLWLVCYFDYSVLNILLSSTNLIFIFFLGNIIYYIIIWEVTKYLT